VVDVEDRLGVRGVVSNRSDWFEAGQPIGYGVGALGALESRDPKREGDVHVSTHRSVVERVAAHGVNHASQSHKLTDHERNEHGGQEANAGTPLQKGEHQHCYDGES